LKVKVKIEDQDQKRLRRAGSESKLVGRAAVSWWVTGWGLAPVVVLSSPGTGGDQTAAGSASGGGFALV
jgi:hypothetical protein